MTAQLIILAFLAFFIIILSHYINRKQLLVLIATIIMTYLLIMNAGYEEIKFTQVVDSAQKRQDNGLFRVIDIDSNRAGLLQSQKFKDIEELKKQKWALQTKIRNLKDNIYYLIPAGLVIVIGVILLYLLQDKPD